MHNSPGFKELRGIVSREAHSVLDANTDRSKLLLIDLLQICAFGQKNPIETVVFPKEQIERDKIDDIAKDMCRGAPDFVLNKIEMPSYTEVVDQSCVSFVKLTHATGETMPGLMSAFATTATKLEREDRVMWIFNTCTFTGISDSSLVTLTNPDLVYRFTCKENREPIWGVWSIYDDDLGTYVNRLISLSVHNIYAMIAKRANCLVK